MTVKEQNVINAATIDLAKEFKALAGDPTWPWKKQDPTNPEFSSHIVWKNGGPGYGSVAEVDSPEPGDSTWVDFIAESPLARAELCLMVVEKERLIVSYRLGSSKQVTTIGILNAYDISPTDYQNVKARVQQATKFPVA